MRVLLIAVLMMAAGIANADWYLRCDPPVTKSASKAAGTTAKAVVIHLKNIAALNAGKPAIHPYSAEESAGYIAGAVRMSYQHVVNGKCAYATAEDKPTVPYVNVWDKLSAANKAKIRDLGLAPE